MGNDDEEWRYYETIRGNRVDVNGNDERGYHWDNSSSSSSSSSSNSTSGSSAGAGGAVGGGLVLCGIIYLVYKVLIFIETHWVTIVTVFGICVACVIACIIIGIVSRNAGLIITFIILSSIGLIIAAISFGTKNLTLLWKDIADFFQANQINIAVIIGICIVCAIICIVICKNAQKPGLKVLFTVLPSAGLICAVIYFGILEENGIFDKLRQTAMPQVTTIQKAPTLYANVISDALNVRYGPSAEQEVVGRLTKYARVEITDQTGLWWKIKFGDIEGYVDSDFLQKE